MSVIDSNTCITKVNGVRFGINLILTLCRMLFSVTPLMVNINLSCPLLILLMSSSLNAELNRRGRYIFKACSDCFRNVGRTDNPYFVSTFAAYTTL
jgi:hypothetical protein